MKRSDIKEGAVFEGRHGLTVITEVVITDITAMCLFLEGKMAGHQQHTWFYDVPSTQWESEHLLTVKLVEEGT